MSTIRLELEPDLMKRVAYFAEASGRTPSRLIADWTLERLATLEVPAPPPIVSSADPLAGAARAVLREKYRPDDVWVLLVGESPPAGGSFFYQADSNLFEATRDAFERALGPMPDGEAFLERFQEMGFWLYDVVREPVNRKRGRPRRDAVATGVPVLASVIADLEPDHVIGIKTSIEGNVRDAAQMAAFPAQRVIILPFPLYQWREEYVSELAMFLNPKLRAVQAERADDPAASSDALGLTLHEAMRRVLMGAGDKAMPARQLANEVARRGLYVRGDGARADYQQLLARARKYPGLFDLSKGGIRLRAT